MEVEVPVAVGTTGQAGHAAVIKQSPLEDHHGAKIVVDEEKIVYVVKQADKDIGANEEMHGKALKDRVDDSASVFKAPKKEDPTIDGRYQVGDEGDVHYLAYTKQP